MSYADDRDNMRLGRGRRSGPMLSLNEFGDQFVRESTVPQDEGESTRLRLYGMSGSPPPPMSSREDGSTRTKLRATRCPYCRAKKDKSLATCGREWCVSQHDEAMEEP